MPIYPDFSYCSETCHSLARRITERPDPITLANEILATSFLAVGEKYGVSDNAIRKWCRSYDLPTKKKELRERLDSFSI